MTEQTAAPTLNCLDCGTPHPGALSWVGPASTIAWLCVACCAKYPSTAAKSARVRDYVEQRRVRTFAPEHQP